MIHTPPPPQTPPRLHTRIHRLANTDIMHTYTLTNTDTTTLVLIGVFAEAHVAVNIVFAVDTHLTGITAQAAVGVTGAV